MKYIRILSLVFVLFTPLLASAVSEAFDDVIRSVRTSINVVIILLFLVATVIFLWGVVQYITAGGEEEKTKEARQMIMWGIIFLAVMVAVWGFVPVVLDFIFNKDTPTNVPTGAGVPQQL